MLLMVEHFWPAYIRLLKLAEDRLWDARGEEFCLHSGWGWLEVTTRGFVFSIALTKQT